MIFETIIIGLFASVTAVTLGGLWFADRLMKPGPSSYEEQKALLERAREDADRRIGRATSKESAQSWLKERHRLDQELLQLAAELKEEE